MLHADLQANLELFRASCRDKDSEIERLRKENEKLRETLVICESDRDAAQRLHRAAKGVVNQLAAEVGRLAAEPKEPRATIPQYPARRTNAPGWAHALRSRA